MLQQGITIHQPNRHSKLKQIGKPRYCADYRRLNEKTVSKPAPLPIITDPIITDTLNDLGNTQVYSELDLRNG